MDTRVRPSCSICGQPAVTACPNADGTGTPFCAMHLPPLEEEEIVEIFRALNWDKLRHRVLH